MAVIWRKGSDLQIAANPNDPDSYYPSANGQKDYDLLHINAMYDLLQHTYTDVVIQKSRNLNESVALTDMVDGSEIEQALLHADRNYESYNNLAHIQEKGWYFLIRIKDNTNGITSGLVLPDNDGYMYRCVLTGDKNSKVYSNAATLRVSDPTVIAKQPESIIEVAEGTATVELTVEATNV